MSTKNNGSSRFKKNKEGYSEFFAAMEIIGSTDYRYLVKLVGHDGAVEQVWVPKILYDEEKKLFRKKAIDMMVDRMRGRRLEDAALKHLDNTLKEWGIPRGLFKPF